MTTLSEIMTSEVFTTAKDATVTDVAAAMVRGRFGSALVTNDPVLLGIFTERDVMRAAASGEDLTTSPVSRWMTEHPMTAEPAMNAEDAADLMLSNGFRHLPVVEGTRVLGIVSLRDVLSQRIGSRAR